MAVVFGILGILCLMYYGVIVIYSGAGTSFSAIWIILALGFFAAAAVMKFYPRFRDKIPVQLEVAVITFFSAIAFIFVVVELMMGFSSISFQKESVNYVIVLGAQVRGNKISRTLERRLDKAVEYAAYHPNTVFVLSGGQGFGEDITEAKCMENYLTAHGISQERLVLEEKSTSTKENLKFSDELTGCSKKNTGILSNNFHVYRAVKLAEKLGYKHPYGIAAVSDPIMQVHYVVREVAALVKEKLRGNI